METPVADVNAAAARVAAAAEEWHAMPAAERLALLLEVRSRLAERQDEWCRATAAARGFELDDPLKAGEAAGCYAKGPVVLGQHLEGHRAQLEALCGGAARRCGKPERRPDGSFAVRVWPLGGRESLLAGGATGELRLSAAGEPEQLRSEEEHRAACPAGAVAVLAAGNYEAPTEAVHFLFAERRTVVIKANPVNGAHYEACERVFEPLIRRGFLAVVHGGVEQGQALLRHPGVAEASMTGAARSFNRIYWGAADAPPAPRDGEEAPAPALDKPLLAELGSVNPFVVVPPEGFLWSDKELERQASFLAACKLLNAGHICASPAVVLTDPRWPQRERFLERVRHHLEAAARPEAYYPGAERVWADHRERLAAEAGVPPEQLDAGKREGDLGLPVVFATGLQRDSYAAGHEAFGPVLAEVPLEPRDGRTFLQEAARYINDDMWGSLSATVLVHDRQAKSEPVEALLDELRIGAIGVNVFGAFVFMYPQLRWGAHGDGHSPHDIQSGRGHVANCYQWKRTVKAVLRFPFLPPGHLQANQPPAAALKQSRRLADYFVRQGTWPLVKLFANVLFGV